MKLLIIVAVIGVCQAAFLQDTPEVQAAKHRFFQEFNRAAARSGSRPHFQQATSSHHRFEPQQYRGPFASKIPAGVDGRVVPVGETPEVQAARRAFEAAFQDQLNAVSSRRAGHVSHPVSAPIFRSASSSGPIWRGPLATHIPAGLPGAVQQVPNTREVEAAISEFNREYERALAGNRQSGRSFSSSLGHTSRSFNPHQPRWTGPLASTIPAGVPGSVSQVPDTHEVAAAKAEFQRAFNHQLHAVRG